MDDWQVLRENVSNFMPDILNARALARQREEWEKDRAEIARQRAEEEQMRQGWMKQMNPQFNTVYTPERQVPNPASMTQEEIAREIDPMAKKNVLQQLNQPNPVDRDNYLQRLQAEKDRLYREQVGPSMVAPPATTIPASTRQKQVPFVPQNYGEAMAQQAFQQKKMEQFMGTVSKPLDFASATGNNKLKEWVANKAEESDIPEIRAFGQLMKKIDFTQPQTMVIEGATLNTMTPEQKKMFGVNPERVYHDNDVATFTKNQDGSVIQSGFKPAAVSSMAKSSISKDYWKKDDKSAVTFDPVSKKYYDADGNQLTSDEIERVPPSAKSLGSALSNRTYSVPGVPDLRATSDGRYFRQVTSPTGEITREYVDSDTVRKKLATTKAGVKTYEFTVKQYDALDTFVNNLEGNYDKITKLVDEVKRTDSRWMNVPLKQWQTRISGDPNEAKLRIVYTELSTEASKIASGAQASIAAPGVTVQEKWDKLHDDTLSPAGIIDVASFTRDLALQRREGVANKLEQIGVRIEEDRGPSEALRSPSTGKREDLKEPTVINKKKPKGVPQGATLFLGKDGQPAINKFTGRPFYEAKGRYWDSVTGNPLAKDGREVTRGK